MMFWSDAILDKLLHAKRKNRLPHAILFVGNKGLGKSELAHEFANILLCREEKDSGRPCYHCHDCQLFRAKTHGDFYSIFPENGKSIGVDQIREIKIQSYQTSHRGRVKFFLIANADKMTMAAANALLKILEEPPLDCFFILTSESKHALPATVLSRCQSYLFLPPATALLQEWLVSVTQQKFSIELIRAALRFTSGSPLLAKQWLEENKIEGVIEIAHAIEDYFYEKRKLISLFRCLQGNDLTTVLDIGFIICHQVLMEKFPNRKRVYDWLNKSIDLKKRLSTPIALNENLLLEVLLTATS